MQEKKHYFVPVLGGSVGREISKSLVFLGLQASLLGIHKPIKKLQLCNLILVCSPSFKPCQIK
jgi:hypothetical protein